MANVNQLVRSLVLVGAYQTGNIVFLSQQTSISWTYHPRNQPANRIGADAEPCAYPSIHRQKSGSIPFLKVDDASDPHATGIILVDILPP